MQERQGSFTLNEEIFREADEFLDEANNGVLDVTYGDGMFKRLSTVALKSWFPNEEPSAEVQAEFAVIAHRHFQKRYLREVLQKRVSQDIGISIELARKECFSVETQPAVPDEFSVRLFNEATQLINKAKEAGPDNADSSYAARAFHRLTETYLHNHPTVICSTEDIGAIAQIASTHLARTYPHSSQLHMAQLMYTSLQRAFAEEGRKVEFPVFDYDSIPEPNEDELDDYGTGYDPLNLYRFTQRIFKDGVYRVRGDDNRILCAILEFDETTYPEWETREEYINSLDALGWPSEIRESAIASLDEKVAEQPDQTPEVVTLLLQQIRKGMLEARAQIIFHTFKAYADHGMRCGVSATLFLALQYADAHYLAVSNASKEEIDKARPTLTNLKKHVADYFADWLTRPLPTKQRDGRKADYNFANLPLQEHFNYTYPETLKAKRRYAVVGHYEDYISLVKREHSDMPDDLILEFHLPDKCKGRDAYIAAEWAARLCGIDDWHYDGRTLSTHVSTEGLRKKKIN